MKNSATVWMAAVGAALAVAIPLLALTPRAAAAEEGGTDGKAIFLAQKCNLCHGVSTAAIEATTKSDKVKGPDLVGLAGKRDADWIKKYLTKQADIEGKQHGKEVKLADAEMQALVDWILAQKPPQ